MDVTRLIFKICYISPLENNAVSFEILIVSPLYMTMTVLTLVYGAVAIASDCANLKKISYFDSYIAVILLLDSRGQN